MSEKEFNAVFSKRLRYYLKKNNMTQLEFAKRLGVGTTSVYNWCNGIKSPRMDKVDTMCSIFNCRRSDLMEEALASNTIKGVKIPVLGSVPAGIPIEAIQDIIDYEEIPDTMAVLGNYYGLKIKGHSMEPEIHDGDVVIVKQVPDVESGAVAIVMVNGDEATCKKVVKLESGISLVSFNSSYDPMFFSNEEIESKPVNVIGKVVELRRKF